MTCPPNDRCFDPSTVQVNFNGSTITSNTAGSIDKLTDSKAELRECIQNQASNIMRLHNKIFLLEKQLKDERKKTARVLGSLKAAQNEINKVLESDNV